jgi:acetolactate synthase-1/2/3 large subunit
MTGGAGVVQTLIQHEISTLYCLPGVQSDHLLNAVYDARGAMRAVHSRHEQGAAYMALGAALATGRPAVYSVVPGPGFLNTAAALATAYSTGAPVLCLAGQIPSRMISKRKGCLHEIPDQTSILRSLTKSAARIDTAEQAPRLVAQALHDLLSGRPRPVGLEIAPDVLAQSAVLDSLPVIPPREEPAVDDDALDRAASALARAERPLLFVGGGALEAADEVRALAERLGAPVVSYRMGRGVLDDRHSLSQNIVGGHALWTDCDVALAIGTRMLMPLEGWGVDEALTLIKIDVDPEEMDRVRRPNVGLVGRASTVVRGLLARLGPTLTSAPARSEASGRLKQLVARRMAPVQPQLDYLRAIRDVLPDEGVLVDELTQVGYVARIGFETRRPRTYLSSGYQGTLGWGVPVALGAKHALRAVPVALITGDGGLMFNVQELATAVHHRIAIAVVLFNDGAYGNVRRMQRDMHGGRIIASDLTNPDFVRLAESFGVRAQRVNDPAELRSALERVFASAHPGLIEVPCGEMPSPWPFLELPQVRGR